MPIRVDLPAPFSPTRPWIVPGAIASDTPRFAWTRPNHLSTPESSTSGPATATPMAELPVGPSAAHEVGDLDLARHNVGSRLLEPALHLGRDQGTVVLVERPPNAVVRDAEHPLSRLPRAVLRGLERLVHG